MARELTKLHEELVRGTLKELVARFAEAAPRGEVTIVVEGAGGDGVEASRRSTWRRRSKRRLADGESPKEIAAALALTSGQAAPADLPARRRAQAARVGRPLELDLRPRP